MILKGAFHYLAVGSRHCHAAARTALTMFTLDMCTIHTRIPTASLSGSPHPGLPSYSSLLRHSLDRLEIALSHGASCAPMQLSCECDSYLLRRLVERNLVGMAVCTADIVDVSGRVAGLELESSHGAGILIIAVI